MINREDIILKLSKDIKKLEHQIDHRKIYNVRNYILKALIKTGIALDYACPYILSAILVSQGQDYLGFSPFNDDEVKDYANIKTIDTSNGVHVEYVSYDYNYYERIIEYSTGWVINRQGLYERIVTSYQLNKNIDLSNSSEILSLTKEELENIIDIKEIKTIYKAYLEPEDYIFDEDAIIIINHIKSDKECNVRKETKDDQMFQLIILIILTSFFGYAFKNKVLIENIKDDLKSIESSYKIIDKGELEKLKKILEIKKKNLYLLECDKEIDNSRPVLKLRR